MCATLSGVCFVSGAELNERNGLRRPVCGDMVELQACPLLYLPVCGTDGNTYASECQLCVQLNKCQQCSCMANNTKCVLSCRI
uniref:Kazal-like domain-containing protein n=1 Tax=Athene cunicularia TaxID=194338 RepID=A0A663N8Q9_ATHCN